MGKRKINKSEKVREYLTEHRDAMPTDGAAALKRYGITPGFFSNTKTRIKNSQVKTKRGGKRRGSRAATSEILAAAELIRTCGGAENAKDSIRAADEIAKLLK